MTGYRCNLQAIEAGGKTEGETRSKTFDVQRQPKKSHDGHKTRTLGGIEVCLIKNRQFRLRGVGVGQEAILSDLPRE